MSGRDWVRFGLLGLIWGTSFLWIKIAVSEATPLVLVGFRTLSGAASLLVILAWGKRLKLTWRELKPWIGIFFVVGLFNVTIPFILISWSEKTIDSGIASILNSTTPLFTMLLAPIFLKDDGWTPAKLLGLILGFGGVVVLMLPQISTGANQNLVGYGTMLLATLSYAIAGVYSRKKTPGLAPEMQSFLQLGTATLMVWGITFCVERPINVSFTPLAWTAMLWLGILGSAVAYILYFALIHSIGPTRTTTVTFVLPLVAVILGVAFLGEQIYCQELLGGAMIVSGIMVVNLKWFQPQRIEEEPA